MTKKQSMALAFGVISFMVLWCGCISTQTEIVRKPVHTDRVEKVSDGWIYEADLDVREKKFPGLRPPGEPEVHLIRLQVKKHKTCTTTEVQQVRQTEVTTRQWKGGTGWVVHGLVVVGAAVAGGALISHHVFDQPYANDYPPAAPASERSGFGATSVTGFALIGGALTFGLSGAFALSQDLRAIDGSKDLGEITEPITGTPTSCQEQPAAGAKVTIAGSEGTTNDAGVFEATISNADLARTTGDSLAQVEGQDIPSQPLVEARKQIQVAAALQQQREAEAEAARKLAEAAKAQERFAASRFSETKGRWTHPIVKLTFTASRAWKRDSSGVALILTHKAGMILMADPFNGDPKPAQDRSVKALVDLKDIHADEPQTTVENGVAFQIHRGTATYKDGGPAEWLWVVAIDPGSTTGIFFTLVAYKRALHTHTDDFFDIIKSLRPAK